MLIPFLATSDTLSGKGRVTFLRVFNLRHAAEKKITVNGWEIFDQYPELILYEGYISKDKNKVSLMKKQQ